MHRETVSPATDQKIFNRTARKTKACNLYPKIMRGGTRM